MKIRPGAIEFLKEMAEYYEIVIFTASINEVIINPIFFYSMLILLLISLIQITSHQLGFIEKIARFLIIFL